MPAFHLPPALRLPPTGRGALLRIVRAEVRAGFPSPADDHWVEELSFEELVRSNPVATFLVRSGGLSMDPGQDHRVRVMIHEGDVLVVDRSIHPLPGHIAVVCLDGEMAVKVLDKRGGMVVLRSLNDAFPEIMVGPERDFRVWGVVKAKLTLLV